MVSANQTVTKHTVAPLHTRSACLVGVQKVNAVGSLHHRYTVVKVNKVHIIQ